MALLNEAPPNVWNAKRNAEKKLRAVEDLEFLLSLERQR